MASGSVRTSAPDPAFAVFASLLQAEHDALGTFISLLQTEQKTLVQGDADRLAALAPEKSAQIDLLARLGLKRDQFLKDQKLDLSSAGVEAWLGRQPAGAAATRKIWRESLRRAEKARQLNLDNGILIQTRMQQNQQRLSALQGAAGQNNAYRPDGQLGPFRGGRSLGRV